MQYLNFNDKLQFLKFLMKHNNDIEWDKIKYRPEDIINSIFEDCIGDNEKEFDCVKGDENSPGCYDDYNEDNDESKSLIENGIEILIEDLSKCLGIK